MNIKNNKGITLVALVITVIIILVIGAITVYEGSKLVDEAKYEDVKTNMLLIQAEVKNFAEQAKFEGLSKEAILTNGITLDNKTLRISEPDDSLSDKIQNIKNKGNTTENGELVLYQINNMSDLNLGKLDNNASSNYLVYIDVSKDIEVEVCFLPGILGNDGTIHYFLSTMGD